MNQNENVESIHANRRRFLATLVAVGLGTQLKLDLAQATEAEIESEYDRLKNVTQTFYVESSGTILSCSYNDYEVPSWKDAYSLDYVSTVEDLVNEAANCWHFESRLTDLLEDEGIEEVDSKMKLKDDDLKWITSKMNEWMDEEISDIEWVPHGWTPTGSAQNDFSTLSDELLDELGIVDVQGDHPGSSYFAMELHNDIDVANEILESKNIPIRFESA